MLPSLVLALVLSADPGPCPSELFRIERSKNANVVLYEARRGSDTVLDEDEPVTVSWLLLATTGKRERLSFFERLFAYGFDVRLAPAADSAALTLKALKARPIRVSSRGSCLAAFGTIDGTDAVLQRIYVMTDEHGPAPAVKYIELYGVDPVTGAARYEKVLK